MHAVQYNFHSDRIHQRGYVTVRLPSLIALSHLNVDSESNFKKYAYQQFSLETTQPVTYPL